MSAIRQKSGKKSADGFNLSDSSVCLS